jgi:hypothetical protein
MVETLQLALNFAWQYFYDFWIILAANKLKALVAKDKNLRF